MLIFIIMCTILMLSYNYIFKLNTSDLHSNTIYILNNTISIKDKLIYDRLDIIESVINILFTIVIGGYFFFRLFKKYKGTNRQNNRIVTTRYSNKNKLVFGVISRFVSIPAYFMTIVIGTGQAWATFDINKVYDFKKANLIVATFIFIFDLFDELQFHIKNKKKDDNLNLKKYRIRRQDKEYTVNSEDIDLDDIVEVERHDNLPVSGIYLGKKNEEYIGEPELLNVYQETGEDGCDIIEKGRYIKRGMKVNSMINEKNLINKKLNSKPIEIKVTKLVSSEANKNNKSEKFLRLINKIVTISDLISILTLCISGIIICGVQFSDKEYIFLNNLFRYFISTPIAANILIPSMRWGLLSILFIKISRNIFPGIDFLNFKNIDKIKKNDLVIYSDKTGTITYENKMYVKDLITYNKNVENEGKMINDLGIKNSIFELIVLLSCSDTNEEGVSTCPEENAIFRFISEKYNFELKTNPLKKTGGTMKFLLDNKIYSYTVNKRFSFCPDRRYRSCEITISNDLKKYKLKIYQGAPEILANKCGNEEKEWEKELYCPYRSFGYCYKSVGDKNIKFYGIISFCNPIRNDVALTYKYISRNNIPFRILTGDKYDAATFVAKEMGMLYNKYNKYHINDITNIEENILKKKNNVSVIVVSGSNLVELIEKKTNTAEKILNSSYSMIIYRTSPKEKSKIVETNKLFSYEKTILMIGDAPNDYKSLEVSDFAVCMDHAGICKNISDASIKKYSDIVFIHRDVKKIFIQGSLILLNNVIFFGALITGFLLYGLELNGFKLLPRGFLFYDPWSTIGMSLLSLIYSGSSISYSICNAFVFEDDEVEYRISCSYISKMIVIINSSLFFSYLTAKYIYEYIKDVNYSYNLNTEDSSKLYGKMALIVLSFIILISHHRNIRRWKDIERYFQKSTSKRIISFWQNLSTRVFVWIMYSIIVMYLN